MKKTQQVTAVAVAQLPFLEILFQKHKILTSLEAILERFVFRILKFRALIMVFFMLYNMVFIKVLVYLSSATSTSVWQNCRLVLRLTFYLNFKVLYYYRSFVFGNFAKRGTVSVIDAKNYSKICME